MDHLSSSIAWCVLQVSLVALAGIAVSLVFARKNPHAACSLVCTATLVATLLTLLAPLPVHRWFVQLTPSAAPAAPQSLPGNDQTATDDDSSQSAAPIPMFDLNRLTASLRSLAVNVDRLERRRGPVVHAAIWLSAAVILMGILQLAFGIAFVRRLRRRSVPVTDAELLNMLREVSTSLGCRNLPELRESLEFTDAAVAGWWRPAIILPCDWRNWRDDERRAVLAHEAAHIVRHDVGWRAAASSLLAFHFYNPLLHWLLRRLMLCQELATDELAATVVGPTVYLRALSSLALRQDDYFGSSVAPAVLPVFSGHLIRRISMLRSRKDSMASDGRRRFFAASISMALFALGAALVVTRGMAQPPTGEAKPSPVPVRNVSLTKSVADGKPILDPTRDMFRRAPIDPSAVGADNPQGMVAVRMHELLSQPEVKPFVPVMNAAVRQAFQESLSLRSTPPVSLESIEWIAARPNLEMRKSTTVEKTQTDEKTQLSFGAGGFAVKLKQPLDLKAWAEQFTPDATHYVIENKDVYQWKIPSVGPVPVYAWMHDETTLRMNYLAPDEITPETKLVDLFGGAPSTSRADENAGDGARQFPWSPTWRRIDNGVGSFILAKADLSGLFFDFENRKEFQTETLDAVERALVAIKSRCQMSACSFDLNRDPSQLGLRISLVHESQEDAVQSAEDTRELLKQSQTFLKNLDSDESGYDVPRKLMCDLVERATISVETYEDQTASVVIATTIPFQRVMELVAAEATAK